MKPQTLAMAADLQSGFEHYRQPTQGAEFLKTMQAIVPCSALCEVIEPHDPKAGNARSPIALECMLRIHFIPHWFNLAGLVCEEGPVRQRQPGPLRQYRSGLQACTRYSVPWSRRSRCMTSTRCPIGFIPDFPLAPNLS